MEFYERSRLATYEPHTEEVPTCVVCGRGFVSSNELYDHQGWCR